VARPSIRDVTGRQVTESNGSRLYVVIPVRNRRVLTQACLMALRAQTYPRITVVVVDDGSTDGTAEMLRRDFPEVVAIRGHGDLWWTGATNVGCAWVLRTATAGDAVVTLNDDTLPGPHWIARLHDAALAHPRALIGSVTVVGSREQRVEGSVIAINWWTAKFSDPYRGASIARLRSESQDTLGTAALSGRGTLIPIVALRELGPYAACLPHYGADYEFSIRAARCGWNLLLATRAELEVVPETTGLHRSAGAGLLSALRSLWSRRSAHAFRYRVRFARLACPRPALPSFVTLDFARVLGHTLARLAVPRDSQRDRR
jgi:GT2 family glycosyltransferase